MADVAVTDERTLLRADLEAGQWQRLTDPLLPLLLLEDASWWPELWGRLAHWLRRDLPPLDRETEAHLWAVHCRGINSLVPAALVVLQARLAAAPDHPAAAHVRAALTVLEQWPIP